MLEDAETEYEIRFCVYFCFSPKRSVKPVLV